MLAFVALVIVIIAETGRLPVDNPATHLELTMVHEAMVLEYAGPRLALVEWASGTKAHGSVGAVGESVPAVGVAGGYPSPLDVVIGVVAIVVKVAALAVALAAAESFIAKLDSSGFPNCWPARFARPAGGHGRKLLYRTGVRGKAMTDTNFAVLIDFAAGGLMLASVLIVWRRAPARHRPPAGVAGRRAGRDPHRPRNPRQRHRADCCRHRGTGPARCGPAVAARPRGGRRAVRAAGGDAVGQHRQLAADHGRPDPGLAFAVTRPLVGLEPDVTTNAVPAAFAVVLIALFVMVTRRHAISQAGVDF